MPTSRDGRTGADAKLGLSLDYCDLGLRNLLEMNRAIVTIVAMNRTDGNNRYSLVFLPYKASARTYLRLELEAD